MLICMQKINFMSNFFLEILQRNSKVVIMSRLGMSGDTHPEISKNLWCLSASKKSTSFFPFSLRYCKDIANLLFLVLWASLVIHTQNSITLHKTFVFICRQKNHFNSNFCVDNVKICKLLILGTLGMSGYAHPKW